MEILRLGQFAYASSEINHQCPGSLGCYKQRLLLLF